jgi:hypothetical protein
VSVEALLTILVIVEIFTLLLKAALTSLVFAFEFNDSLTAASSVDTSLKSPTSTRLSYKSLIEFSTSSILLSYVLVSTLLFIWVVRLLAVDFKVDISPVELSMSNLVLLSFIVEVPFERFSLVIFLEVAILFVQNSNVSPTEIDEITVE